MLKIARYFSRSSKLRRKIEDDIIYKNLATSYRSHYNDDEYSKESREIERVFNEVTGRSYNDAIRYGRVNRRAINNNKEDISQFHADCGSGEFPSDSIISKGNGMPGDLGTISENFDEMGLVEGNKENSLEDNSESPILDRSDYDFELPADRVGNFESMKGDNIYQDLTREESQRLQEFEAKARIKDPLNELNTNKIRTDPVRDAKNLIKTHFPYRTSEIQELEEDDAQDSAFNEMFFQKNRFDEIISRIRTKIRQEKAAASNINKSALPNIKGLVVDPIKRHVNRRAARIGTMLHTHIEQLLTCNDPEFLYHHLKGASISINHVLMDTSKSLVKCYYNILSDHDPNDVQNSLDSVAPKVRFWIARKLELGYTPPIKFIKYNKRSFVEAKDRAKSHELGYNLPLEYTHKLQSTFHRRFHGFR